jgi:hypothetical protein
MLEAKREGLAFEPQELLELEQIITVKIGMLPICS